MINTWSKFLLWTIFLKSFYQVNDNIFSLDNSIKNKIYLNTYYYFLWSEILYFLLFMLTYFHRNGNNLVCKEHEKKCREPVRRIIFKVNKLILHDLNSFTIIDLLFAIVLCFRSCKSCLFEMLVKTKCTKLW